MRNTDDILAAIYPVIRMHNAAGARIEVKTFPLHIVITSKERAFAGKFVRDFSAVCFESNIAFAVDVVDNQPCILL